jgi:hypothetical protein
MALSIGRLPQVNNPAESVLFSRSFCSRKMPRPEAPLDQEDKEMQKKCKSVRVH